MRKQCFGSPEYNATKSVLVPKKTEKLNLSESEFLSAGQLKKVPLFPVSKVGICSRFAIIFHLIYQQATQVSKLTQNSSQ